MFEGYLEDCMGVGAGIVLSGLDGSFMEKAMEKTLTHLTKYIPADGFVNGFDKPTKADLVVLMLTQALIPFGATLGGYDFSKFPEEATTCSPRGEERGVQRRAEDRNKGGGLK